MMKNLDIERIGLAAMSLGIARACLDHSLKYAQERQQFGESIINFQSVSEKIANMYTLLNASRTYLYTTAMNCDCGKIRAKDAASALLFASENATQIALQTIQCLGGNGYINEFPAGRLLRDAKLYEIGAGTTEIRRLIIARELLREVQT